jgi:hypothetical protein
LLRRGLVRRGGRLAGQENGRGENRGRGVVDFRLQGIEVDPQLPLRLHQPRRPADEQLPPVDDQVELDQRPGHVGKVPLDFCQPAGDPLRCQARAVQLGKLPGRAQLGEVEPGQPVLLGHRHDPAAALPRPHAGNMNADQFGQHGGGVAGRHGTLHPTEGGDFDG